MAAYRTWAAAGLLLFASHVHALGDADRAVALKKQGDELMHAAKFKEALDAYDQSFAIVANPAIQYNRARAMQSLGDFVGALAAFEEFSKSAPADLRAKVPNLDKMIAEVASHVATLVVDCAVPGASVSIGGKVVGTAPVQPYRGPGGDVTVLVTSPGYVSFTEDTTLIAGQTTTVKVDLKKAATDQGGTEKELTPFDQPKTPPPTTPAEQTGGPNGGRTLAWVSGAVGVVSLAGGGVFLGLALADKSSADPHCPNKVCDAKGASSINDAWTASTVSTVLVVVGAVALATSVVAFIVSGGKPNKTAFLTPGGLGGVF